MVLEPHYEWDSGTNALAAWEADSGEGFKDAGLASRLVADDDDGGELNALFSHLEVAELVDGVEEWSNAVVVGGRKWRSI